MGNEKIKYHSISGLRAISIILVIIHHLSLKEGVFDRFQGFKWLAPLTFFLKDGNLGVNIFFVISGFLITSLMLQEEAQTKDISLKNFYIRRTLRIFPAFYFLLIVYFVLQQFGVIYISSSSWITAITYTKYFNWQLDWFTSHAWSLSVEEHFYLFWPLIFMGGASFRKNFAFTLLLIVPIVRIYLYFYPIAWMHDLTIFTRIDSIATGCLFALYKDEIIKKISPHWGKLFYASVFCLFCLSFFALIKNKNLEFNIYSKWIFVPFGYTHGTIANFFIGFIMMYSVFGPQNAWFKFLNLKAINYIGLLSYGIYLWQQLLISGMDYWVTTFPQNIVFTFTLAMFSFHFIEQPFLKLKSRFAATKHNIQPPIVVLQKAI